MVDQRMVEVTESVTKKVTVNENRALTCDHLIDVINNFGTNDFVSKVDAYEKMTNPEGVTWEMNNDEIRETLLDLGVTPLTPETDEWRDDQVKLSIELSTVTREMLKAYGYTV